MKKIKFFPAPHVEVRVSVTDEMVADLRGVLANGRRDKLRRLQGLR